MYLHRDCLEPFLKEESGAVTTDWVVLTGAAFLLAAAVVVGVRSQAVGVGDEVDATLESANLPVIGGL
ncbi:MAG: hypothetical protein GVY34_05900 [Alphaproteobacteria bacterium]|nr:hypothetical protein [Alphaproteobacteria bacterium]